MNCLEFRRARLAQPYSDAAERDAHAAACPSCAEFLARLRRHERALKTMLEVPAPAGLVDRVIFTQTLRTERRSHRLWAMAASLLIAVSASLYFSLRAPDQTTTIAAAVAAHVREDPLHRLPPDPEEARALAGLIRVLGGTLERPLPRLIHARPCVIRGQRGAHLVIASESGPVTLVLLPGNRVTARTPIDAGDQSGWLLPSSSGAIAVLSTAPLNPERYVEWVQHSIRWRS